MKVRILLFLTVLFHWADHCSALCMQVPATYCILNDFTQGVESYDNMESVYDANTNWLGASGVWDFGVAAGGANTDFKVELNMYDSTYTLVKSKATEIENVPPNATGSLAVAGFQLHSIFSLEYHMWTRSYIDGVLDVEEEDVGWWWVTPLP